MSWVRRMHHLSKRIVLFMLVGKCSFILPYQAGWKFSFFSGVKVLKICLGKAHLINWGAILRSPGATCMTREVGVFSQHLEFCAVFYIRLRGFGMLWRRISLSPVHLEGVSSVIMISHLFAPRSARKENVHRGPGTGKLNDSGNLHWLFNVTLLISCLETFNFRLTVYG